MALRNLTLAQVLAQLDSGFTWSGSQITYSFPTSVLNFSEATDEGAGFSQLTATQIQMATYALGSWDDLIALNFVAGTGATALEFGNTTTGIEYAHAYFPSDGSIWFNPDFGDLLNPVIGEYGYGTFIHEIGHALGLNHMGDYNGGGSFPPESFQDSSVLSIMSYFGPDQGQDNSNDIMWADWIKGGITYAAQTPMLNDIYAMQQMYGVSTTTRLGDTVYGFNSNVTGNAAIFFDFTKNANPVLSIFDSGGIDTLDLSGFSGNSRISLVAGTFTDTNEMTNNISIAYTAVIENAVGGAGNDRITGNDVANVLTGRGGNDTIDGGAGRDTAVFRGNFADYTIENKGGGSYAVTGADGTDTLTSIEVLKFDDREVTDGGGPVDPVDPGTPGETVRGDGRANKLRGSEGDDTISGLGGNDKLSGLAGADTLDGGKGNDTLTGGAGADVFKFGNKVGFDTIRDFSFADGDQIDLSGTSAIKDFDDLFANHLFVLTRSGDAYIEISRNNAITLKGIDAEDLTAEHFLF